MDQIKSDEKILDKNTEQYKIYILGGCPIKVSSTMDVYTNGMWNKCPNFPTGRSHFAVVLVNNIIYVIGGRNVRGSNESLTTIETYNILTRTWSTHPLKLIVPRSEFGAVVKDGIIYCLGGHDFASNSLERIMLKENTVYKDYKEIPGPRRWGCGVALCGNKIYVTGGHFFNVEPDAPHRSFRYFDNVQTYDLSSRMWTNCQRMLRRRCYHSVATSENFVYAAGGFGPGAEPHEHGSKYRGRLDSVERFDITTGQWTMMAPIPVKISNFAMCSTPDKKLLIIGGLSGGPQRNKEILISTHEYDISKDTWTSDQNNLIIRRKLMRERHSFSALVSQ